MLKSWSYIRPNVNDNFSNHPEHFLNESRLPFLRTKEETWQNIQMRISESKESKVYRMQKFSLSMRLVAGIAILVGLLTALTYFMGNVTISSEDSKLGSAHIFPDGSLVTLNTHTEISYNKWLWNISRDVEMNGEAFYSVQQGPAFEVQTSEGTVRVLGTSFNVIANPGVFEVSCKTGKVAVSDFAGASTNLEPGMSASLTGGKWKSGDVTVQSIGGWVEEEFNFDNTAVSQVFEIIGNETNFKIVLSQKFDLTYSGQINKNQDIKDILNIICLPLNLKYEINGDLITITKIQSDAERTQ